MTPKFILPAKMVLFKCKSVHVTSLFRTSSDFLSLPVKKPKPSPGPMRPYWSVLLFHLLSFVQPHGCACRRLSNTLAPQALCTCCSARYVPPQIFKWHIPSLLSGPCSDPILSERPSLTTLNKGEFPFPFLLIQLDFSLWYLLPLCLFYFIFQWSVLPSSMRAVLKQGLCFVHSL